MANINRKWRRAMAVGCTHGDHGNPSIQKQVLAFEERYKPDIRFDLGDVIDTAAFRAGARGTPDESADVRADYLAGVRWLERYRPTHIAWGNHDARLVEMARSPNGALAYAATELWNHMQKVANKLKAQTRAYDYEHGWFKLGGTYWGHGYWYNEAAVRDHAEYLGGPVVMAHLHVPQQVVGRTRHWTNSFCVGTLADIDRMSYARRRRATSRWGHGVVFGEVSEDQSALWLTSCQKGEILKFPL